MSRKPNNYNSILKILQDLHKLYPNYNMGRHLATILDEYRDVWGLSDKELLFALNKYKAKLQFDNPQPENIDEIIEGGMHLTIEEEDGQDY